MKYEPLIVGIRVVGVLSTFDFAVVAKAEALN
jgi:hypothetical protein